MSTEANDLTPLPEEPSEFLPSWDLPVESAQPVEVPPQVCPSCQGLREDHQAYCLDCGFVFPEHSAAAVPPSPPPQRVQERYEIGKLLSERAGVSRYEAMDAATGNPVVIVRARLTVVEEPVLDAVPVEALETLDFDLVNGNPENAEPIQAPATLPEIELFPSWPSLAWEKHVLEQARHPSLPAILSQFVEEDWEYLVEEVPTGQPLWDAWDDPETTHELRYYWLKQVAEALQELHRAGAMPEVIRPEMMQVTPAGQARLTTLTDLLPLPLPRQSAIRGSLYTAPELVLGDDQADARANLYSFGGLLYSLLIGRELAETDFERNGVPRPFLSVFPDCHPLVGRLMAKTFCRDVSQRFPTDESGRVDPSGFTDLIRSLDICRRTLDRVRLEMAAWTTTGIVRSGNEDAFYMLHATEGREDDLDDSALVILADGMGGAEAGEVAAEVAVRTLRDFFMRKKTFAAMVGRTALAAFDRERCERVIAAALRQANAKVVALSVTRTGRAGNVGCTAEAVFVRGRDLVVGHVGDSRVYLYQDGRIQQITRDHTLVNRMVDMGMLTQEEADQDPERSDLYQALGGRDEVEPAIYHQTVRAGAWILVCSDGLINHLSAEDLQHLFEREAASAESAARRLVNYANLRGGIDNTTVVVVRVC